MIAAAEHIQKITQENPQGAFVFSSRQAEAMDKIGLHFTSEGPQFTQTEIEELLFGGAKGGGKSRWGVSVCALKALAICVLCKLEPTNKPIPVGFMGRKRSVDFTKTTLQSWKEQIPESWYRIKEQAKQIILFDRVLLDYGGLDDRETVNKFNSAEYVFFFLDQAEECTVDEVSTLRGTLRKVIKGISLPTGKLGIFTANPANCFLKYEFVKPEPGQESPKRAFVQALPDDNPFIDVDDYLAQLQVSFGHRKEVFDAYRWGSWDSTDDARQVIRAAWIKAAKKRTAVCPIEREFLVCDPARYGDDSAVIDRFVNTDIAEQIVIPYCPTTEISSRLAAESMRHGDCMIVVESTGGDIGAGVIDELISLGRRVLVFNPAAKSEDKYYYNLRAEAWWEVSKKFCSGIADEHNNIPMVCTNLDSKTEEQLQWPMYDYKNGRLIIEKKEDIKERMNCSPDHGDTYVIGMWAFPQIPPKVFDRKEGRYREKKTRNVTNPMCCG